MSTPAFYLWWKVDPCPMACSTFLAFLYSFPYLSLLTTFWLRISSGSSPWACLWHSRSFHPLLVFVCCRDGKKQCGRLAYCYTIDWMDPILRPSLTLFSPYQPLFVCKQKVKNYSYVGQENCVEHPRMLMNISTGGSVAKYKNAMCISSSGTWPRSFLLFPRAPPLIFFPLAAGLCFSFRTPSLLPAPSLLLARAHLLTLHLFLSPSKNHLFTGIFAQLSPQVRPPSRASKNPLPIIKSSCPLCYRTLFSLYPQKNLAIVASFSIS